MKLIVGLGNIGKEYDDTRHNLGFFYLDRYLEEYNITNKKIRFDGCFYETMIQGEKIIFVKPLLFMNLSGIVVKKFVDYYKIDINNILVIHDDMDILLGKYKLKLGGSSGGHNGINSIIDNLGSDEFKRLKIGIGKSTYPDTKDYVLGKFNKEEKEIMNQHISRIVEIINDFVNIPFEQIMSRYNGNKDENI